MKVLIKLHETETVTAFLYNAETWTLTKSEKKTLDQAELYAWKRMIGLPPTTPTAGIVFSVGALFASIRVEQKQLIYIHKVLTKDEHNWTKTTLLTLKEYGIGWARQLDNILETWGLEKDWEVIRQKPFMEWKRMVASAAEKRNNVRLREECETLCRGEATKKKKTVFVLKKLDSPDYKRQPDYLMPQQYNSL